jgi:ABC-type Fe3+/spermidine/putrescine transport system ATPase subunit
MEPGDEIIFFNGGNIECIGTPDEIRMSDNHHVKEFIEM